MRIDLSKQWVNYVNFFLIGINVVVLSGNLSYALCFPVLISVLFFMTRYAVHADDQKLLHLCVMNTFILSINGLLFDYLRMSTIAPVIAFIIAAFLGKESVSVLMKKSLFPIYGLLISVIIVFSFLGQIRNKVSGYEKINSVLTELNRSVLEESEKEEIEGEQEESFEARVSNINQTSQVVEVVEEDGYYMGETMAYLSYAFIPRFIWKDKPVIAQGIWFAVRIGKANIQEGGGANNSINMTSAGELFLNFGWMGVMVGMFIIGALCAYMWQISGFSGHVSNILGGMFGLYLFSLATSTFGVDLQFVVTMVSYFCLFQFANYVYLYFSSNQNQTH